MQDKALISGLFTVILLLLGYLWSNIDKRLDSMEDRFGILTQQYLVTREAVNRHSGILKHHP